MAKNIEKPNFDAGESAKREILNLEPDCEEKINYRIQKLEFNNNIINNDIHKVRNPEVKKIIEAKLEKSKKKIAYYKKQAEGCDDPNPH
jgi:3-methyladenine DNA glycosylase AlkD